MPEIIVGRQEHQFVTDTELRKQRVDRSDLYTLLAANVA
jgi:hypothetical protein